MKFKKLVCMGMAVILVCSGFPQIAVQAKEIREAVVSEVQSEQEAEKIVGEIKQQNLQSIDVKTEEVNPNQEGQWYGNFEYEELEDGTIEITGYKRGVVEIIIPAEIKGKKVIKIRDNAFLECRDLNSISIPEGVIAIGDSAFYGCSSLSNISIPKGVTEIGNSAFSGCSNLVSISIPEGVTEIEDNTFYRCSSLSSISIPEGVTTIGDSAFYDCSSLSSISIPKGVTKIENNTFSGCSNLVSINIPEGVTYIGNSAFSGCSNLASISIPEGVTEIEDNTFYRCSSLSNINIPEGVTTIGDSAFYDCSSLSSINIPEEMLYIGSDAFEGCSSLGSINIPKKVTKIRWHALRKCYSLSNINISEGVTEIGNRAFEKCYNLSNINIPEGVTKIADSAFYGCSHELTFIVARGSYAENYAKKHNIKYHYIGEHTYNYTSQTIMEPSCTKEGIKTYTCTECGSTYQEDIPATGHTYQSNLTQATTKKNGSITQICSKCGVNAGKTFIIYAAKTIKLSKTSVTYNNKVQKPSVTVKDSKGKALTKGKDYTVTYPKGMKNVGKYTIKIQLKGNYQGSITKTFTITPKAVSITKIIPKSKGFTIKWKKETKQVTGYQISYATNKNFVPKATKTKTISNANATTKTISKLKAKKPYYIKIRTYKEVKVNGKVTKLYSNWSKSKKVTTKK